MSRMTSNHSRLRMPLGLSSLMLALSMLFLLAAPNGAQAATNNYCNNVTLGPQGACAGTWRAFYALYGWGDQHSVCVSVVVNPPGPGFNSACSGGPGQGVYDPMGQTVSAYPGINNNSNGTNVVHGVAYIP